MDCSLVIKVCSFLDFAPFELCLVVPFIHSFVWLFNLLLVGRNLALKLKECLYVLGKTQASIQFRPQNRDLGMVMREVDEDLAIFLGIRNVEIEKNDHLLVDESHHFDDDDGLKCMFLIFFINY